MKREELGEIFGSKEWMNLSEHATKLLGRLNWLKSVCTTFQLVKTDGIYGFQFGNQKKPKRPVPGNNGQFARLKFQIVFESRWSNVI